MVNHTNRINFVLTLVKYEPSRPEAVYELDAEMHGEGHDEYFLFEREPETIGSNL